MKRRDFLKLGATAGVATIVMGSRIPFLGGKNAFAAGTQTLEVTITDCMKQMVTHNEINDARCYFWIYTMALVDDAGNRTVIPPENPGPTIYAEKGDSITISVTNALDEPHSFFIPGNLPGDPPIFDSGVINPGQTVGPTTFTVNTSGAHMYYDNLNEPVNRVMGLHGALVVKPAAAFVDSDGVTHNFSPYDITSENYGSGSSLGTGPAAHVQKMYDMFGTQFWPGLRWQDGHAATNCPPFRQYVWLYHMASPKLQAAVGSLPPGQIYDAKLFCQQYLRSPFSPTRASFKPDFFTINGQSGFFSHFVPAITPIGRVGEPVVIHILNAGLQTVSHHMHCNHFFITSINGQISTNPIWLDIYGHKPMERTDYTFPFMRPPDNANARGIGRPDTPLITTNGQPCWPPLQEMETHFPPLGTLALAQDGVTPIEMGQRLSPLCYPAHDHIETSQTAQGGNYNQGLISGAYISGDRNTPGHMNFPMDPDFFQMYRNIRGLAGPDLVNKTGLAAGPRTSAG
jgi:hypothetical protein